MENVLGFHSGGNSVVCDVAFSELPKLFFVNLLSQAIGLLGSKLYFKMPLLSLFSEPDFRHKEGLLCHRSEIIWTVFKTSNCLLGVTPGQKPKVPVP